MIARTTMGELQAGDKVLCSDGQYRGFKLIDEHMPSNMFLIETEDGSIKASGDHLWTLVNGVIPITMTSEQVHLMKPYGYAVGKSDGPRLTGSSEIETELVRCIQIDTEDHLFEVLTDKGEPVLTHNCGFRAVAGTVKSVASIMALGNTLGTTIDSSKQGRGIVQSQGQNHKLQYYYEEMSYIRNYYSDRGLTMQGWPMSAAEIEEYKNPTEKVKEEDVKIALDDLPYASDDLEEAVNLEEFEFMKPDSSNLTIEEMDIDIEIQAEHKPIGNIEL